MLPQLEVELDLGGQINDTGGNRWWHSNAVAIAASGGPTGNFTQGMANCVALLAKRGADTTAFLVGMGQGALHMSANRPAKFNPHPLQAILDAEVIKADAQTKINCPDQDGNTALHIAAAAGNKACVTMLLDTGLVDLGVKNKSGKTAAELAKSDDVVALFSMNKQDPAGCI